MDTMQNLTEYLGAAKTALDIFRGIRAEMPQGPLSDEAGKQIETAAKALKASEAKLAKSLGFQLCKCSWPPVIMLWNNEKRATACPACGYEMPEFPEVVRAEGSWSRARRGR